MATLSSVLARKIPWTEEPGGLRSMGLRTVGRNCEIERCHGQGCFHVLAIVSSGTVNIGGMCVFRLCFSLDISQGWDCRVIW